MNPTPFFDALFLTWLAGALGMLWLFLRFLRDDLDLENDDPIGTAGRTPDISPADPATPIPADDTPRRAA